MSSRPLSPTPTRFGYSTFTQRARGTSRASRLKLSAGAAPDPLAARMAAPGSGSVASSPSFSAAVAAAAAVARPGDMVLTLGAGSVSQLGAMMLEKLDAKAAQ